MEFEVMKVLYANKKNGLKVAVINPPSIGEKRRDYLTDIALATSGLVVDLDTSTNLEAYDPEDLLGKCSKIAVTKEDTVLFFNERLDADRVQSKIDELDKVIKNSNNKMEKEYLQDRISKLACGVSIIKVGGTTEVELKEKLDRVDDAINAVKSAISEGVVSGGGLTLFNASFSIEGSDSPSKGYNALREAIKAPMSTILLNAGLNPTEIQEKLLTMPKEIGYDVKEYQYTDMFKSGIIDPAKAIRLALENAASVAVTVLLTNTTITHKRDEGSIK
jgi:chaperonin GroEL